MVQALRHRVLPPTLHVERPSDQVDWGAGAVSLLTELRAWRSAGHPRRAGVSAFGISGTNAHLILEEAPDATVPAPATHTGPVPLLLSARGTAGIADQARALAATLADGAGLADTALARLRNRAILTDRAVVVAGDTAQAVDRLTALGRRQTAPGTVTGTASATGDVVFMFPGQGAQFSGMARGLHERFPAFTARFDEVCALLDAELVGAVSASVRDVVFGTANGEAADLVAHAAPGIAVVDQTVFAQTGLFAVEIAMAALFASVGVRPAAVVGHSVGEVAAACVAGVLSLGDAARLVAARARAMQAAPPGGAMVAVAAPETAVTDLLGAKVALAAVNGPESVVLSGDRAAVTAAAETLRGRGTRIRELRVSHAFHSPAMDSVIVEFAQAIAGITWGEPTVPLYVTGPPDTPVGDPAYWADQIRRPVRFGAAVAALTARHRLFLEVGPGATLGALVRHTDGDPVPVVSLRRNRTTDETHADLLTALAELHVRGATVDWAPLLPAQAAPVVLPTYVFQRARYWLRDAAPASDVGTVGLDAAGHPLLGAVVELPHADSVVFTERVGRSSHPWLVDHAVAGSVLVPGAALAELAVAAGDHVGSPVLDELLVEVPLVLPERGAVRLRIAVDAPDELGRRPVSVHSAPDSGGTWTRHAAGFLVEESAGQPGFRLTEWPPEGAEPVDVTGLYPALADAGYAYGPLFQGLRAMWRLGPDVFADVVLPESLDADRFGVHPALLDAALHAGLLSGTDAGPAEVALPFAWNGFTLHASGARVLRVWLTATGRTTVTVRAADESGDPVFTLDSLMSRPLPPGGLVPTAAGAGPAPYRIGWRPIPGAGADAPTDSWAVVGSADDVIDLADEIAGGAQTPGWVLFPVDAGSGTDPGRALEVATTALDTVTAWLGQPEFDPTRLAVLTRAGVAVEGRVPDPAVAAVCGLVRSAQAENPGRIVLLDTDTDDPTRVVPVIATAAASDEWQAALCDGTALVPRLGVGEPGAGVAFDPDGTVLVTGGTGVLGALIAEHLVTAHGVRHLVLVGRGEPKSAGAADTAARIGAKGAEVRVVACDIANRDAVADLVGGLSRQRRLTGIVHAAGVLDDGVLGELDPERLATVFAPKVDGATHLDEVTRRLAPDLDAFVLFSSAAGVLGSPGQANYAAANAYLDALAETRRAAGLPALSLAWGPWRQERGMSGRLTDLDHARAARSGIRPLGDADGLALFDAALTAAAAVVVPLRLDPTSANTIPAQLRGLVRPRRRKAGNEAAASVATAELTGLSTADQRRLLVDLVRAHAAEVLGHPGAAAVPADAGLFELGLDSLTAIELRNRIGMALGLRLPSGVIFDHPTPDMLADHLRGRINPSATSESR